LALLGTSPSLAAEGKAARVDALGDPLPAGAIARLGTLRLRHQDWFLGADLSPDGKLLASVGEKGILVRLWDTASGKEVRRITAPSNQLVAVKFSPTGRVLAGASDAEQHLFLWQAETGKLLHRLCLPQEGEMSSKVFDIAFADGGKSLVSIDSGGTARWWSVADGTKLREWKVKEAVEEPKAAGSWKLKSLESATLTPGGRVLAAVVTWASADNKMDEKCLHSLAVWDLERRKQRWQLAPREDDSFDFALSPDGKVVAMAVGDGDVSLRDGTSGRELRRLEARRDEDNYWESLAFSADGKLLAAFGHGLAGVCVWEVGSGKVVHKVGRSIARDIRNPPRPLLFSPDSKRLLFSWEDTLALWDVDTWKERPDLPGHRRAVHFLAFSDDGKTLVSGNESAWPRWACPKEAITWDTTTWREASRSYDVKDDQVLRSRDHRLGVIGGPGRQLFFAQQPGGKRLRKLDVSAADGHSLGGFFSPSGRTAVLVLARPGERKDHVLVLVDVATGKRRGSLPLEARRVFLAFAPDEGTLAWVDTQAVIHVVTVDGCKELCRLGMPRPGWDFRHSRATLTFSPACPHLAFWEREKPDVVLWDWQAGTQLCRLPAGKLFSPTRRPILALWPVSLTFSPDGRCLAIGGMAASHDVDLWEVASGQLRRRLPGHLKPVSALAFSPDGRLLASGSGDTTILVWDLHGFPTRDKPAPPEALWACLADADVAKAAAAMTALVGQPAAAATLLGQKLQPAPLADAAKMAEWIAELDSEDFARREQATHQLDELAEQAGPALQKALREQAPLEARRRIERLLEKLRQPPPQRLRLLRAVEVLEQLRTEEARQLLQRLAEGAPDARLTREARASLQRLR
jgi:WD40 repeat protein